MNIRFEWDEYKALANQSKHGISFDEAKSIFSDPFLLSYRDETHSNVEEHVISIGMLAHNRLLLVVHTEHFQENDVSVSVLSVAVVQP